MPRLSAEKQKEPHPGSRVRFSLCLSLIHICNEVRNISGEAPNIVDLLQSGLVDYVFSTSAKGRDPKRDSVRLRRKAVELSIPCILSLIHI